MIHWYIMAWLERKREGVVEEMKSEGMDDDTYNTPQKWIQIIQKKNPHSWKWSLNVQHNKKNGERKPKKKYIKRKKK